MRPGQFLSATIWLFMSIATAGTAAAQDPFRRHLEAQSGQEPTGRRHDEIRARARRCDRAEGRWGHLLLSRGRQELRHALGQYRDLATDQPRSAGPPSIESQTAGCSAATRWKLSTDGQKLSVTTSGVKADGDLYTTRQSMCAPRAQMDLMGAWKSTDVKLSSPG